MWSPLMSALGGILLRTTSFKATAGYSGIRTRLGKGDRFHKLSTLYFCSAMESRYSVQKSQSQTLPIFS